LDDSKVKLYHIRIATLSSAGSLLDGYDISVVSVAILILTSEFSLNALDQTLLLGSTLIGMIFGGVFIGYLTDKKGRRKLYMLDMALFILFTVLTAISFNFTELVIFRLFLGVAIGADYAISPTIIAEFAPVKHRGQLLTLNGMFFFIGAAISYLAGFLLIPIGEISWRYLFLIGVIPATIILVLRTSVPESPRWLANRGNYNDADKTMESLGLKVNNNKIEPEKNSFKKLFQGKYLKYTIFISIIWFSLDAVAYVLDLIGPTILESLKLSASAASGTAAIVAMTAIVGAVITLFLIDKVGRKPITSIGFLGMAVSLFFAAYSFIYFPNLFFIVIMVILLEIFEELGPGITTAIYPQELYPTEIRATAQGFGTTISRIGALVGIGSYMIIASYYGNGGGLIFLCAVSLIGLITVILMGTETKNKSLEETSS
uniref:MFS transporter n=1 Tax=Ferroplasma sp. TaxID=2591003 RepID=UPI00307F3851